jgi:uncharacterized repeat protein (TIGR01451 family)
VIRRALLVAAGLGAFALGAVALVAPSAVPVRLSTLAVSAAALVPLVLAYRALMGRYANPRYRARPGNPERAAGSTPGRDLRATLAAFGEGNYVPTRQGLRGFATSVLTRFAGYTTDAVDAALDAGTWTDDPDAVAFFAGSAPPRPRLDVVRNILSPESPYRRRLRHAVDALTAVVGVPGPPDPSLLAQWRARLGDLRPTVDADGGPTAGDEPPFRRGGDLDDPERPDSPWPTGHLWGVSVVTLVAVGLGALSREPALVLVGVVGVGFAALGRAASPPDPSLTAERTLDPGDPDPGDAVEVTLTVSNEGDRTLPDLRIVDGVPAGLSVADGSARLGTVLRPGSSATLTYTVDARAGEHAFDPTLSVARDAAGSYETVERVAPDGARTLTCRPRFTPVREPIPLRERTSGSAGSVPTAGGGGGVEFHAVREYRRGDPLARVDWRRHARTGDLATREFREERAASVVLLVDARPPAYVAPDAGTPHAVARSVAAAGPLAATLLGAGDRVGLAALSPDPCWVPPGAGRDHRADLRETLTGHPALAPTPPAPDEDDERPEGSAALPPRVEDRLAWLRRRLSPRTQVLCCSPLADPASVTALRRLDAHGYPVTVVSPDPTATGTPGGRVARVARRLRVADLRSAGIPVVDWRAEDSLAAALSRAQGWSR